MQLLENIEKRVKKWLISFVDLRVIFAIFICLIIYFEVLIIFYLKMNSVENKEYSVLICCFAN